MNDFVKNKNIPQEETPLVVAFTPNYFIPAATCLWSVLKNSDKRDRFHVICLLTIELSEDLKKKLKRIDSHNQMRFSFVPLNDKLKDVYVNERYTVAASYRLLIPKLLPEYDKVIYLDCDMIIRNNLAQLYRSVDLGDNYLAAVFEATLDFQVPNLLKMGFKSGEYFNSGFLVMNLALLRKDNMTEKLIDALKVEYLEFPDQDVLNMLCKGRIIALPPYYNSIRTFYLPQYKHFFLRKYSETDWAQVWEHGNIHYTGDKPWRSYTVEFDVWWRYFEAMPPQVRESEPYDKKMYVLYKVYSNPVGKFLINGLKKLYRRLK